MQKKLKIAVYSGKIPTTTFIESLIKALGKSHEVLLFGTQTKTISYPYKTIKIHKTSQNNWIKLSYNIWRTLLLLLRQPKDLIELFKAIKGQRTVYKKWQTYSKLLPIILYKPNVLHIQWAKDLENLMVLKTLFNIPLVVSLRGSHITFSPVVSKKLAASYGKNFPEVDAFHAVSKAIGVEAEKFGAPTDKIHLIYSMVPKLFLDAYQPLKPKTSNTINILSVGRPHWIKGYTYAIRAIAELKNQGYSVQYQIVGMNRQDEELLFLISELCLEHDVILHKGMSQDKLMGLMQTQDVLLLSSLEEGIANVVLEAMAVGLPVISTDCGGMNEVVINGKTGFLVPKRDPKAMAQAVIDLQTMPITDLQQQTQQAHDLIKAEFNAEKNLEAFLRLYEGLSNE